MPLEIIAEIGASHQKNLVITKRLCLEALEAGADWIKLQTFTPDTISHRKAGVCTHGPWKGRKLYDLYKEAYMPLAMQDELIAWMKSCKIPWFSTPFSATDVKWLEARGCPRYKISSFDRDNPEVHTAVRATGKMIIQSDGMGDCDADIVLRCVSEYPASPISYGLFIPPDPRSGQWGISDHTMTSMLGIVAVAKGAQMIEKHIRSHDDHMSPDATFAIDPWELGNQIKDWRDAYKIADSSARTVSPLKSIRPKPIKVTGKTVWRRG